MRHFLIPKTLILWRKPRHWSLPQRAYTVSVPAIWIPRELKSTCIVIHDHCKFPLVVWLSHPIYVFKLLVIQNGMLVTDVNDRSVEIVIQYINIQQWLAARHAPDLWLSLTPAAAPAHPSSPPCTPSPPEWNQQKQTPNPSERPTLFHVKNSKWAVYGKKFGLHFPSPLKELGYRCVPTRCIL